MYIILLHLGSYMLWNTINTLYPKSDKCNQMMDNVVDEVWSIPTRILRESHHNRQHLVPDIHGIFRQLMNHVINGDLRIITENTEDYPNVSRLKNWWICKKSLQVLIMHGIMPYYTLNSNIKHYLHHNCRVLSKVGWNYMSQNYWRFYIRSGRVNFTSISIVVSGQNPFETFVVLKPLHTTHYVVCVVW